MIRPILVALIAIATPFTVAQADGNRGNESVHQPVVQRSDYVIDVSGNGIDAADGGRIRQWLDAISFGYGDRLSIDSSMGSTSSNGDIAAIVATYGMFVSEGAPVTEGAIQPGQVRIVVSRATASVPGCPDHSQWSQPNFTGATSSNFGCGVNSALAAMVANPEDLVRGQQSRDNGGETGAKAVRVWRNADPTSQRGLKIESTTGGK